MTADQLLKCRAKDCEKAGWNVRWLGRAGVGYFCLGCVQEFDAKAPEEPAPASSERSAEA